MRRTSTRRRGPLFADLSGRSVYHQSAGLTPEQVREAVRILDRVGADYAYCQAGQGYRLLSTDEHHLPAAQIGTAVAMGVLEVMLGSPGIMLSPRWRQLNRRQT